MRISTPAHRHFVTLLGLISLLLTGDLFATPPDVITIRETIIGADDSVMALYELRTDNQGSHFMHEEKLTFVLREIESGREVMRQVVSRVEYVYDFDIEEFVREVREAHAFDLAGAINEHNLSLSSVSEWELPMTMVGERMVGEDEEGRQFDILSDSLFLARFAYKEEYPEELEYMSFKVVRTYSCFGSEWDFVEVATVSEENFNATTRIIPILQSSRIAPAGDEQGSLWESWDALRWLTRVHTS